MSNRICRRWQLFICVCADHLDAVSPCRVYYHSAGVYKVSPVKFKILNRGVKK